MTPRKTLLALAALVAAALVGWLALPEAPAPTPEAAPVAVDRAPAERPAASHVPTIDDPLPDLDRARRARYRVEYTVSTTIGGDPGPTAALSGRWQTEGLADGRVRAALDEVEVSGGQHVARADELRAPIEMIPAEDGTLVALGFAPRTTNTAKRMFTALATAFWFSPGDGAVYEVEEQDAMGPYLARYARVGDDRVVRTIDRFLALRGPDGRSTVEASKVRPDGRTDFVFDRHGLARVELQMVTRYDMGESAPEIVSTVELRFERIDQRQVVRQVGVLNGTPIGLFVDYAQVRAMNDDKLVAGATAADMIADVQQVAGMDPEHPDYGKWRSVTVRRLAALVRVDPAAAAELAAAVHAHADDQEAFTLLLGGLGSADSPTGAATLAELMGDDLPAPVRRNAIDHLALTNQPSAAAAEALTAEMAGDQGDAAAAALGAQAQRLADTDPDAAERAVDALLERYMAATSPEEATRALRALGNSGDRAALDILKGSLWADDAQQSDAAIYGLRNMPGDDVDDLLADVITRGEQRAASAVRAVEYRDEGRWRPELEALRGQYAENDPVRTTIDRVLENWNADRNDG